MESKADAHEAKRQKISNDEQALNRARNELDFLRTVGKLKNLKRTGWVKKDVNLPESVSDHMYRMGMCSFLIQDPSIDKARCMKIALVHDLAEALAGDITPHCGVSDADKHAKEEAALDEIVGQIQNEEIAKEIKDLWLEYENVSTPEAAMVKDFDKFEMILQADEYECAQEDMDLSDFFESTRGVFKSDMVKALDTELRSQRSQRLEEK
uniref:5'-deoxynucleotidase n=1 Tax=Fibrocapsa japonica TaxID=94617 RepID=A0A7S2UUH7_9STRA